MKQMDLLRLVEECGEVIQAAGKILRFGQIGEYDDGTTNMGALLKECGDVLACIDQMGFHQRDLDAARGAKMEKIERLRPFELGFDSTLSRAEREELHRQGKI